MIHMYAHTHDIPKCQMALHASSTIVTNIVITESTMHASNELASYSNVAIIIIALVEKWKKFIWNL